MYLVELVLTAAVLLTLLYASILDLRTREVGVRVWLPAGLLSVILNLWFGNYNPLQLLITSIPALLVLVFAVLDMMGGADFLALLVITLAHPKIFPKPLTYLTLIYSLIIPAVLILRNLIYGLRHLNDYKKLKCIKGSKKILLLLGRPANIDSFFYSKFTYLLTIPVDPQKALFECRASFSLDDAYEGKIKSNVEELLDKGSLKADDIVWVTPGLPQITFYLFGYVLALITPESLLHLIIP
ncbi:MAG: A24 family peptidase C-terminal domain-containing protein [Desulfurococcaceae archaeon TW002]